MEHKKKKENQLNLPDFFMKSCTKWNKCLFSKSFIELSPQRRTCVFTLQKNFILKME